MTPKQKKIAAKAEPRNKIDGKDFAVLRAEKAKNRGKGLQDEKMKPGKIMKANKGDMAGKHFFDGFSKVFKGAQDKGRVATIVGVKPGSAIGKGRKQRKRFKSLEEMRKAKGFKPGETVSQFNKRQQLAKRAVEAARATRIGKIVLPIAAAGVGAVQLLKSKMKKKEEKPKKKMGGGMMMRRPIMASRGAALSAISAGAAAIGAKALMANKRIADKKAAKKRDKAKVQKKMGGGMMMRRPMMANKGKMADKKADKKTSKFIQRRLTLGGGGGRLPIPLLIGIGVSKAAKEFFKKRNPGKFPYVKPNQKFLKSLKTKAPISKKMGGGMMMKPMMADKGLMAVAGKTGYKKLMEQRAKDRITDRDVQAAKDALLIKKAKPGDRGYNMLTVEARKKRKADVIKGMGGYMGGGLSEATQKLKAQGKMGGGMMQRPMMAMGGGMMPGYKKGKSVMAKGCKLGRKKPTKMYT